VDQLVESGLPFGKQPIKGKNMVYQEKKQDL